jgi:hypothetical protein
MISDFVSHEVMRNVRSHTSQSDRDPLRMSHVGHSDDEESRFDHPSRGGIDMDRRPATSMDHGRRGRYSWKQSTKQMERPQTALSSSKRARTGSDDRVAKAASRHGEVRAFWDRAATALGASILSPSVVKYILLSSQNEDDSKRRLRNALSDEMMKEGYASSHPSARSDG